MDIEQGIKWWTSYCTSKSVHKLNKGIHSFTKWKLNKNEPPKQPIKHRQTPKKSHPLSSLLRLLLSLALHFITLLKQELAEHTERIARPSTKAKDKEISKPIQHTSLENLDSHSTPLTVRAQQTSSRQADTARPSHWDRRAQVRHRDESGLQGYCPSRQAACWSRHLFRPLWMWVLVGAPGFV